MIPELLAITPGDGRALAPWIEALAAAGLPGLLVREPEGRRLADLLARARDRLPFVAVHARCPDARALAARLDLPLHLPSTASPEAGAGSSCHDAASVDRALASGAAWALLSPVWRPGSKPADGRTPLGPDRFCAIAAGRPVLALGGVTPARHRRLRARGAHGSAVLDAVFGQDGPEGGAEAVRRFLD